MVGFGPVRVYLRLEFVIFGRIYTRIDYFGSCEMFLIPTNIRRSTGQPLCMVRIDWAPFALNIGFLSGEFMKIPPLFSPNRRFGRVSIYPP